MPDKNWIRWIRVGVREHFEAAKDSYYLLHAGVERDAVANLDEWAELRVDGPNVYPKSGQDELEVDINIILTVKPTKDIDKIYRISGVFHAAFTSTIPIYKKGGGPDDDDELLGCLALDRGIKYNYFGDVDKDVRLEQASLLARYRLEL